MPLSNDTRLAWNFAGCVGYWQPVRAPGPLLARYNMAHGGDNRYRATDGVAPTWTAAAGWTFNGSSQYLLSGITPITGLTVLVRFLMTGGGADRVLYGSRKASHIYNLLWENPSWYAQVAAATTTTPSVTSGVIGTTGTRIYLNGVTVTAGNPAAAAPASPYQIAFGAAQTNDTTFTFFFGGVVAALLVVSRPLSAAEVWQASRQMAYCDVNPDWSVWGRRRQWFALPGGFQAAWARNANSMLQVGRQ